MYRENGTQKQVNLGHVSPTVARKCLAEFENKLAMRKMGIIEKQDITLESALCIYFAWCKNKQAKKTLEIKEFAARNFKRFIKSAKKSGLDINMMEINNPLIERYTSKRKESGVCNRTINIELDFISNLIRKTREWEYMAPDIKIEHLREVKKAPRFFSDLEIELITKSASKHLMQIIQIGLYTGMRIGEMLNMKWEHIDWHRNMIHVVNTKDFSTKNKKDRSIPTHKNLKFYLEWLCNYRICPTTDRLFPRESKHRHYVITNAEGTNFERIGLSYRHLMKKLQIPDATLHTLRHTFASRCIMSGADLVTVRDLLGHSDIRTTMIYAHINDEHRQRAIKRLNGIKGGSYEPKQIELLEARK